jgi:16S rRNA processing protein RimM
MQSDKMYFLGKILKPVGLDGKMMISLDVDDPQQYAQLDAFFAMVGGNLVPFLITDLQLRPGKQAVVSLQDIDDPGQTDVLVGSEIFLPIEALPELNENQFYFHEIPGFLVIDSAFGEVGKVAQVLEYPKQALLQIFHNTKEVLIPVADEIITKVDKKNRIIYIAAPEGLIEMYLE